jgi:hypothetical protein
MPNTKEQLLEELKQNIQALQELQKTNKEVLKYLPKELKEAIVKAKLVLKPSSSSEEPSLFKGKNKKSKCTQMRENWQSYIIDPFTKEIEELINSKSPNVVTIGRKLAENYYSKYRKKKMV